MEGGKNRLDLYLFVEFLCQNVLEYKNEYYLLNIYLYKYIGTYLGFAYSMVLCVLHFQITQVNVLQNYMSYLMKHHSIQCQLIDYQYPIQQLLKIISASPFKNHPALFWIPNYHQNQYFCTTIDLSNKIIFYQWYGSSLYFSVINLLGRNTIQYECDFRLTKLKIYRHKNHANDHKFFIVHKLAKINF